MLVPPVCVGRRSRVAAQGHGHWTRTYHDEEERAKAEFGGEEAAEHGAVCVCMCVWGGLISVWGVHVLGVYVCTYALFSILCMGRYEVVLICV